MTRSMQHLPGLLALDWDAANGKLYLEIAHLDQDLLYVSSLPYGTGSNDLGLDRGQMSESKLVRFERFGSKVMLVETNSAFRSNSADPAEQLAVRQSFPESVLAAFKIAAQTAATDGNQPQLLVDATEFFERDAHHVGEALAAGQKNDTYKLDALRSSIVPAATRAFPQNVVVESLLTFATDAPGRGGFVRDVAPDVRALTVRERQSFIRLPGPGYVPRRFDPRAGYFGTAYRDYTAPLGAPLDQTLILRHRLIKRDAQCTNACEPLEPIRYYVDRGAPEPVRSALVDGARWWDEAFQAAGWAPGTFRVDLLPEDADPMDVRYNIIQWVHRYTRGWSYGHPVADPRTGEIIKGNVTLGSLRGRQDYLIAEALLSPYVTGGTGSRTAGAAGTADPMLDMVLARLRQLSAHETGHTLGLAHNFAASSVPHAPGITVSVMDYPHPWIVLDARGVPDVSQAYGVGIGAWDKVAIEFGYRQFPAATDEAAALDHILRGADAAGLPYITDEDARPVGSAHPHAHLWDNGTDPAAELTRIMAIRAVALARFGENAIKPGMPMAQLEDTLVPLYLLHRYQTEAAIKELGGLDYRYQLRGDGQPGPRIVDAAAQQAALAAVLNTLSAPFLTLPESLLHLFPPRPPGLDRTRESMPSQTGLTFDPVSAAECAADLTLRTLFAPERAARLIEYHARDPRTPSLPALIDATLEVTRSRIGALEGTLDTSRSSAGSAPATHNAVDRASNRESSTNDRESSADRTLSTGLMDVVRDAVYVRTIEALLALAADPTAAADVRAVVRGKLAALRVADLNVAPAKLSATDAFVAERIDQLQRAPEKFVPAAQVDAPPGMPIGDDEE